MTSHAAAGILAEQFAAQFRETLRPIRLIGREAEFPVVWPDGRAGDVLRVWPPLLEQNGLTPQYDDPETRTLIVALKGPDGTVEVEVGRATIEIVLGPYEDLWQLAQGSARLLRRAVAAVQAAGMRVLGFGIQPRTRGSPASMTPKLRYAPLLEAIGHPWLNFAVTASDQVQVDITRRELPDAINVLNLLRISQNYGTTEAGIISARLEWTPRLRESVGRPVRHRIVTIVDADGRPQSPGSVGGVMVQSPALARAYLEPIPKPSVGTR